MTLPAESALTTLITCVKRRVGLQLQKTCFTVFWIMMEGASCVVDFGAYAGKALIYPLRKTGVGLRVWAEPHLHSQQNPF